MPDILRYQPVPTTPERSSDNEDSSSNHYGSTRVTPSGRTSLAPISSADEDDLEYEYEEDSDTSSVFMDDDNSGANRVEAAHSVWGPRSQWFLFIGIGLSSYIYSLDGLTTWQYLSFATSNVLKHSLSGTISTAQAIIIAVGKPLMAKLADVVGRAETFIIVTVLYVTGYVVIATAQDISHIAIGEIFYAFGYTGLQMLQQIVIADMTTLRWRGLVSGLVSAPFIINNFISAEITARVLPNWRWGYGMFAILVPVSLLPIIVALLWAQWKARKPMRLRQHKPLAKRPWTIVVMDSFYEMDFMGLLLIASSLSLILLPLGVAPTLPGQWRNPSMAALMAVGIILFPIFVVYEKRYPSKPVMPLRLLRRGPILGACLIGFLDFVSFFLLNTYLYSFVYVTRDWSYRALTYFSSIQTMSLTIFGIVAGTIMYVTQRFKMMLAFGLYMRLLGVFFMLKARGPQGSTFELIITQILQGAGGGLAAIAIQVSAQAAVAHIDVATVTAMVLLVTEVGNSVGSAIAAGVWAEYMPGELKEHVPTTNGTLLEELFGSMENIARFGIEDPIRRGAITAYENVMGRLVILALVIAIFPPIFCLIFTENIKLTKAQNAHDGKDLSGIRIPGDPGASGSSTDDLESRVGRGRVRLRSESMVSGIRIFEATGGGLGSGPPGGRNIDPGERLLRSPRSSRTVNRALESPVIRNENDSLS